MPIIEEEDGRLNAFAKEPRMEVVDQDNSYSNGFRLLFIIIGALAVVGLIVFSTSIS